MESKRRLRLRAVLERWLPVLLGLAIVGTAVFGWFVVSTHVLPGTHSEERVTASWSTQGDFDHRATVQEENSVFPTGTTLADRPLYYTQVMPNANGTFDHRYEATGGGSLAIAANVSVVIRSTGDEGSVEYWRVSRRLTEVRATDVSPGEAVPIRFSVNVSRVQQTLEEIRSDLGSTPGTLQTAIVANVEMDGTVRGQQVNRHETYRLPVSVRESTYSFGGESSGNQYEQRERVTVRNQYSPARQIGSLVGFVVAGSLLSGLTYLVRRDMVALSDVERERLAYLDERAEYADWITRVELPEDSTPETLAPVESLEGLVDLAIDTEERVLEDSATGRYLVTHDGVTYVYEPPVHANRT